jgi:hypothetical protein
MSKPSGDRRSGSVAIIVAILLVVLVGFTALGAEVGTLLMISRKLQAAADTAALAGAVARARGYPTPWTDEPTAIARAAGLVDGVSDTTIAINSPPTSGAYAGDPQADEVIITQLQPTMLMSLFVAGPVTVRGRAVATTGEGGVCGLSVLSSNTQNTIYVREGATATLTGCGVAANSSSSRSITIQSATLTAQSLTTVGNYRVISGGTLNVSGPITTGAPATVDPYASRPVPALGTCRYDGVVTTSRTLVPGTYCNTGGISVGSGATATFSPGIYIVRNNNFTVQDSGTAIGSGVTIVLTATGSGTQTGMVVVQGGGIVNLTAPSSGTTAGMVFFQDRRAQTNRNSVFQGASQSTLSGALYFPNTPVTVTGGATLAGPCVELISRMIDFRGGSTVNVRHDCAGVGITPIGGGGTPKLVE